MQSFRKFTENGIMQIFRPACSITSVSQLAQIHNACPFVTHPEKAEDVFAPISSLFIE